MQSSQPPTNTIGSRPKESPPHNPRIKREDEKQYWHPHNYEILSGQLVAPGLPDVAEIELMKTKVNSYGKTWHFWRTGSEGKEGAPLPLGEPELAWSFNRDGEVKPDLLERRDRQMGISSSEKRKDPRTWWTWRTLRWAWMP